MKGMTSINKFKGIVKVKVRIMNFSLKFITSTKLITSFNGQKNQKTLNEYVLKMKN